MNPTSNVPACAHPITIARLWHEFFIVAPIVVCRTPPRIACTYTSALYTSSGLPLNNSFVPCSLALKFNGPFSILIDRNFHCFRGPFLRRNLSCDRSSHEG